MNKNGVIAVVVVVASIVLVGLWAMRSGEQGPPGADCAAPPSAPHRCAPPAQLPGKGRLTGRRRRAARSVTTYIIEAGSAPGANNQGTFVAPVNGDVLRTRSAAQARITCGCLRATPAARAPRRRR